MASVQKKNKSIELLNRFGGEEIARNEIWGVDILSKAQCLQFVVHFSLLFSCFGDCCEAVRRYACAASHLRLPASVALLDHVTSCIAQMLLYWAAANGRCSVCWVGMIGGPHHACEMLRMGASLLPLSKYMTKFIVLTRSETTSWLWLEDFTYHAAHCRALNRSYLVWGGRCMLPSRSPF